MRETGLADGVGGDAVDGAEIHATYPRRSFAGAPRGGAKRSEQTARVVDQEDVWPRIAQVHDRDRRGVDHDPLELVEMCAGEVRDQHPDDVAVG